MPRSVLLRDRAWSVPSRLDAAEGVCMEARRLLEEQGLSGNIFAVDLLLRECINNGIIHAHAIDPAKRVEARMRIGRKWILIRVADRGPGFDWRKALRRAPDDAAASGRGLAIARLYAARVRFSWKGSTVELWIGKADRTRSRSEFRRKAKWMIRML